MNRHHDQGKSYKKQHLIGAGLQVQRFSPLSSMWEHGSIWAGMAQEELRVLCLHPKAASGRLTSRQLGWGSYTHTHSDTPIPTRSHLFRQGHTFRWCHSLVQGYTNHHIMFSVSWYVRILFLFVFVLFCFVLFLFRDIVEVIMRQKCLWPCIQIYLCLQTWYLDELYYHAIIFSISCNHWQTIA